MKNVRSKTKAQKSNGAMVIEKNVPIEKPLRTKYPFGEMEVGDSFVFPGKRDTIYAAMQNYKRLHVGTNFVCYKDVNLVLRCWRTA